MDRSQKIELIELKEEMQRRVKFNAIKSYYPNEGALRRDLYPKHMQFFALGTSKEERLFMAANRVGKTEGAGGYEMTLHLTGDYPIWWPGRRFDHPIDSWAAGDTAQTTKEIIQEKLLGKVGEYGSGLIPKDLIVRLTPKRGHTDAIETIYVKHKSGGVSELTLKSFDQGRRAFQGTKKHVIWLDEEPPAPIYTECLLRTTDTKGGTDNGLVMLTFTPLLGLSEVVLSFLPGGRPITDEKSAKGVVTATWDDVPHLTKQTKEKLWGSIPPYQRDARSKGIPQLGSGAIYPVQESDFLITDIEIPKHWPRAFALDVGWNRTAAIWGALDRDNDILYLTSEYYRGEAEPASHAAAIRAPGKWIPGVCDPAANGRNQKDGSQLIQIYKDLGLDLDHAINTVESGIFDVFERLTTGRLKVFRTCQNWLFEFRLYRRDEKGRIVKENDHLMDCTRYLCVSGLQRARTKPNRESDIPKYNTGGSSGGWVG